MKRVTVYVDGSSVDVNANKAGVEAEWHGSYGAVFYEEGREVLRMRGYEKGGTIGKMELTALLSSMRKAYQMSYSLVEIFGDNQYVVNGATKWLKGWNKKKFKDIKFPELWREVDIMLQNTAVVYDIKWVRGHNGDAGNEAVDKVAREALGQGITEYQAKGTTSWVVFEKVYESENVIVQASYDEKWDKASGPSGSVKNMVEIESGIFCTQESLAIATAHRREIHDTFPEMVKKKPDGWIKGQEQKMANRIRKETEECFALTHRPLENHLSKKDFDELIKKAHQKIKEGVEEVIEWEIEKFKKYGTRSTGNQG